MVSSHYMPHDYTNYILFCFFIIFYIFGLIICFNLSDHCIKRKKKKAGSKSSSFTEGWVEFRDKRIAKRVAASLHNTPMANRKRSPFSSDLWCIKVKIIRFLFITIPSNSGLVHFNMRCFKLCLKWTKIRFFILKMFSYFCLSTYTGSSGAISASVWLMSRPSITSVWGLKSLRPRRRQTFTWPV